MKAWESLISPSGLFATSLGDPALSSWVVGYQMKVVLSTCQVCFLSCSLGYLGGLNQEKDTLLHFSSANQQTNKKKKKWPLLNVSASNVHMYVLWSQDSRKNNWLLTLRAYSPQQLDGKQVKWKYSYQVTLYCIFFFFFNRLIIRSFLEQLTSRCIFLFYSFLILSYTKGEMVIWTPAETVS